jgi:hypothetical protein
MMKVSEVKNLCFRTGTRRIKMEKIELKIEGNVVTCDWWSKSLKELFCSLCEKETCDPITCQVANPWCG